MTGQPSDFDAGIAVHPTNLAMAWARSRMVSFCALRRLGLLNKPAWHISRRYLLDIAVFARHGLAASVWNG